MILRKQYQEQEFALEKKILETIFFSVVNMVKYELNGNFLELIYEHNYIILSIYCFAFEYRVSPNPKKKQK